jgi:hypothetical protein
MIGFEVCQRELEVDEDDILLWHKRIGNWSLLSLAVSLSHGPVNLVAIVNGTFLLGDTDDGDMIGNCSVWDKRRRLKLWFNESLEVLPILVIWKETSAITFKNKVC